MRVKTINYLNLFTKRKYKQRLSEYVKQKKEELKLKKKSVIDEQIDKLYQSIIFMCSDLYLKKNYWNDNADYERFDAMIFKLIQDEFYLQCNIKRKAKIDDKEISKTLKELEADTEHYDD